VDGFRHIAHRLVAEAAIDDGWGDPGAWLREAAEFFALSGHPRLVLACRSLLRRAGAPLPRRGRGDAVVPPHLRRLGLTSREMDVLLLIGDRMSNAEIAKRLYLSPRTVEKHVERLMTKTGTRERVSLAAIATEASR
jgi:DNA-binding CsgD family transcriptional regulator